MDAALSSYTAAQTLRRGGREPVRQALLAVRERTLALADAYARALAPAGWRVPYSPALNPPLWELGHVAWFQEYWTSRNCERDLGVACNPVHERGASLQPQSDRWYDSSRVEHRSRWDLPLPDAGGTFDYLARTLAQTLELLDRLPADAGHDALYFFRLVALHEAMHAEAATYMARSLGVALPTCPSAVKAVMPFGQAQPLQLPAQRFMLGAGGEGFAFDNELGAHSVAIAAFEIDAAPVSWARFMPFVQAGGYETQSWWSEAGWIWLRQQGRRGPGETAQDFLAPAVHLSAYEAEAWCRWAGRRLPTEAEWECAALTAPGLAWGQVWEWTATPFEPYPGFTAHPYRDYSAPWFGSRRVLRGACEATSPWLAHPRYRNFFEPQRTDIFAGFRSCA
jgi:iron(II)-dependent oxidoreductase